MRTFRVALFLGVVLGVWLPTSSPARADDVTYVGGADVQFIVCNQVFTPPTTDPVCVPLSSAEDTVNTTQGNVIRSALSNPDDSLLQYQNLPLDGPPPADIDSASGCNGRGCINITGQGLTVNGWVSTAIQYPDDGCIKPTVYFNYKPPNGGGSEYHWIVLQWNGNCVSVPNGTYTKWSANVNQYLPKRWANQTVLCNVWAPDPPLAGHPCETVHS